MLFAFWCLIGFLLQRIARERRRLSQNCVVCLLVLIFAVCYGQTCELDIGNNPLYRAPERYIKPLELLFAGYRKEDPIPVPEIAVPVGVPNHCWKTR